MSHVSCVELEIKDLDALAAACEELGLELVRNQKTWKWWGQWVADYHGGDAAYKHGVDPKTYGHGEHVIRLPGCPYEIGLVRNDTGQLVPVYDHYGHGQMIAKKLGAGCEKLKQGYAKAVALAALKKKGFVPMKVETTVDNKIKITLRG